MSVSNGQLSNATTYNNAFMSRTANDSTTGKKDLQNADAASGANVTNVQREINSLNAYTGRPSGSAHDADPSWTNNDVGTSGDSLKERAEALTVEFDETTGHAHSGAAGDGGVISAGDLDDLNYFKAEMQTFAVTASGTDDDVSAALSGRSAGGGTSVAGVITDAPYNKVYLVDANGAQPVDAGGQVVYGRLTFSASVWTLTYYTNEAGVETSYSFSSTALTAYFREVFTLATMPTIGADMGAIGSLDYTAEIVDASATQRGVVSTGVQSFAGNKTFTGTIGASNLSGTNTGDATVGAFGSTPNASGASITSQAISLQPANATNPGAISTSAQDIPGLKTFKAGMIAEVEARFGVTNDNSTTGSNATVPYSGQPVTRFTLNTLASISAVSGFSSGGLVIWTNISGNAITLNNGATLITGTGGNMVWANNSSIWGYYDNTSTAFRVVGGSGAGTSPLTTKGDVFTFSTVDARLPVGSNGQVLSSDSAETTGLKWVTPAEAPASSYELSNLAIAASVASSELTVSLKDLSGSDPSVSSPVKIGFRSSTLTSGVFNRRSVTSALSMVVDSGATLGVANGAPFPIYVYALDNAGTVELAVSSTLFDEGTLVSTTACSGSATDDGVMYSEVARTNVPFRLIGRMKSTQTTAGTWAAVPTEISLIPFKPLITRAADFAKVRVTGAAPAKLGEYRSMLRGASNFTYSDTNGAPTATPSSADGFRIYNGGGFSTADTNNQPTHYYIYVGKNKNISYEFYSATGRTGMVDCSLFFASTLSYGYVKTYDPTTGIVELGTFFVTGSETAHHGGVDQSGANAANPYFDIIVRDNKVGS